MIAEVKILIYMKSTREHFHGSVDLWEIPVYVLDYSFKYESFNGHLNFDKDQSFNKKRNEA